MTFYIRRIRNGEINGSYFTALRVARLYPVHILTLIITGIGQFIRTNQGFHPYLVGTNDFYHFVLNLFGLQATGLNFAPNFNYVGWTISVEMILYCVFFWICKKSKNNIQVLMVSLICIFAGWTVQTTFFGVPFLNPDVGRGAVAFFWGCILAMAYPALLKKMSRSYYLDAFCFLVIVGISIIAYRFGIHAFGDGPLDVTPFTFLVFPAAIYLMIHLKTLRALFSSRVFVWGGEISYSLFLIHFPIQLCLVTLNDLLNLGWNFQVFQVWMSYTMLCLCAAHLLQNYFEKPCSQKIRTAYLRFKEIQEVEAHTQES